MTVKCKITSCMYNKECKCIAEDIEINYIPRDIEIDKETPTGKFTYVPGMMCESYDFVDEE